MGKSTNRPKSVIHIYPEEDDMEAKEKVKDLFVKMAANYIKENRVGKK